MVGGAALSLPLLVLTFPLRANDFPVSFFSEGDNDDDGDGVVTSILITASCVAVESCPSGTTTGCGEGRGEILGEMVDICCESRKDEEEGGVDTFLALCCCSCWALASVLGTVRM